MVVCLLLPSSRILETLFYSLVAGIDTTKAVVDVENALINDVILLLMVAIWVALWIASVVGFVAPKTSSLRV
jgi:hypothetical protein